VIVSTPALREKFLEHNPNTYFIPNMLDYTQRQWSVRKPKHKNVVIGYYGSPTHYFDLLEAIPAITRLMNEYPNLEFHYGVLPETGLVYNPKTGKYKREINTANPEALKYLALSKDMPQDRVKILKFGSIYQYGATYADFDIAIAPLADTPMNYYKSPLKILEPAAYDLPVVASPREPFMDIIQHTLNGYIAENENEWYTYLKRLVDSENLRQKIGGALGYHVRLRYDISKRYREWYYVIQTIARRSGKPFTDLTKKPMPGLYQWFDRKWGRRD
jgi:glycosyltransferase involved in cell wall biosynthesis